MKIKNETEGHLSLSGIELPAGETANFEDAQVTPAMRLLIAGKALSVQGDKPTKSDK